MSILSWAKIGAVALLCLWMYHLGGDGPRAKLETVLATQSENTAKAVLAERASAAVELSRVNSVLKGYTDAPIDPAVISVGSRVLKYARIADCPLSAGSAAPAATISAGQVPRSDPEFERLLQAAFDAADADAKELTALQQAWPR